LAGINRENVLFSFCQKYNDIKINQSTARLEEAVSAEDETKLMATIETMKHYKELIQKLEL